MLIRWAQPSPTPTSSTPPVDAVKATWKSCMQNSSSTFQPFSSTGLGQRPASMLFQASDVPLARAVDESMVEGRCRCERARTLQQRPVFGCQGRDNRARARRSAFSLGVGCGFTLTKSLRTGCRIRSWIWRRVVLTVPSLLSSVSNLNSGPSYTTLGRLSTSIHSSTLC